MFLFSSLQSGSSKLQTCQWLTTNQADKGQRRKQILQTTITTMDPNDQKPNNKQEQQSKKKQQQHHDDDATHTRRSQFSLKQAAAKYGPMEGCTHGNALRGTKHETKVKNAVSYMMQQAANDKDHTNNNNNPTNQEVVLNFWSKQALHHYYLAANKDTYQCLLDLTVQAIFEYQDSILPIHILLLNVLVVRAMMRGFGFPASSSNSDDDDDDDDERNEMQIGNEFRKANKKCKTARGLLVLMDSLLPCACMAGIVSESVNSTKTDLCMGCSKEFSLKKLKNCPHCKLVSYCSKECQLRDYPNHTGFCKTVAKK